MVGNLQIVLTFREETVNMATGVVSLTILPEAAAYPQLPLQRLKAKALRKDGMNLVGMNLDGAKMSTDTTTKRATTTNGYPMTVGSNTTTGTVTATPSHTTMGMVSIRWQSQKGHQTDTGPRPKPSGRRYR